MNGNELTVLIPTYNAEDTIKECLESVKWADDIIIVDSFSTDDTLEICREYTDRIYQHEYINSAAQKNWSLQWVYTKWLLQIDADEYIEPALRDEIISKLSTPSKKDGYFIPIKNLVWGKWIRSCGMYPCHTVRVFRTSKGRWEERKVHARVTGLGNVGYLKNHIVHYDVNDISDELQQFARQVVVWEANELIKKGKRWHWWDVTMRPLAIFFLYYFRQGGFKDGFRGFFLSVYRAFYSFMTYARLYEYDIREKLR